jgi:hypothetical protein
MSHADHFDLLNHDDIYAAIREWLRDRSDPPTAGRGIHRMTDTSG